MLAVVDGETKSCATCKEVKQLEQFIKKSTGKHGRGSYCKHCFNAMGRQRRIDNPERARAADARHRAKPNPERAAKAREYMRVYNAQNREHINAYVREWGKRNLSRKLAYNKERRARLAGNGVYKISPKDQRRLDSATTCGHCGCGFTESNPSNVDHRIPIVRGGAHSIGNLWVLCRTCNFSKRDAFYSVWRYRRQPLMSACVVKL